MVSTPPSEGREVPLVKEFQVVRSIRLLRWGGILPFLASVLVLVALRLGGGGSTELAWGVGGLTMIGQVMVWSGMARLRGSGAWADGVVFPLLIGGLLSAQTLYLTQIPALMPIPLLAPVVGLFAKWHLSRSEHVEVPR